MSSPQPTTLPATPHPATPTHVSQYATPYVTPYATPYATPQPTTPPPATPSPAPARITAPSLRVHRDADRNAERNADRTMYSVPRVRNNNSIARRNALFSPEPGTSIVIPVRRQQPSVHQIQHHAMPVLVPLTPENPEYWRLHWRQFVKTPMSPTFIYAIQKAPMDYQDDINEVLFRFRR